MVLDLFLLYVLNIAVFSSSSVQADCEYFAVAARCEDLNNTFPDDLPSRLQEIEATGSRNNVMKKIGKDDLKPVPNLKKLDLSSTTLKEIAADTFDNNRNMTEFKASGNELTTIEPGTFSDMPMIETLDLSSNSLKTLPDDVFTGSSIKILQMSGNDFSAIPVTAISPLKSSLERFEFTDSKSNISIIRKGDFSGFTKLKNLQLSRCGIRMIEEGAFDGLLFGNDGLVVSRNPYNCSCDILPFYMWAKENLQAGRFSELKCEYPSVKSFSELDFTVCRNVSFWRGSSASFRNTEFSVWITVFLTVLTLICY